MSKTLINFVHANGFPAGSYQTLFNYLPTEYQIISHEKYGHDERYPVENNWQPLVDELINFVKQQLALHNQEQVFNVGHSFGGVIAFIAACQQPALFKGLIMLDPPVITGATALGMKLVKNTRFIDKYSPSGKSKIRRTHWPLDTDVAKLFSSKRLFKNFDERCLNDYVKHGIVERNGQLELAFSAQVETDIFRNLADNLSSYKNKLNIPATLIYAEKTDVCPHIFFKKFAKLNKSINVITTPGSHMFPLEQPENTANLIKSIIDMNKVE
ncbi:alpha/beta hydrolase [Colwellia sp. 4_MG-2023]|jgi:pimeloyl-ACP methyl ester carboxylesterase|uniref:alpha/beta fold hydrolase n=1 Tax=unclassified Colwellia TaxID=196834 RepID=UPI001C084787|nr:MULTISPECIES: alpha/beta hydrolase [unclassified Colwellia]MBU2923926.1 alpha/beta hydrolase [Colwellia sp. C2M11]MDO6507614.1 alpha/beta hydrolase [Colwellia sp. 5_MG-2023]MDO6555610.1 alpha/beta hydrolase [Colwellia sp. 4_MG-2023]MDO6653003.1 alpha/beta hydrolase [Colwellia sp. 3_MG-2023]MDO6666010.1 alpha/beta hydrolase [Colwellia sp. 2_MG-2023]